MKIPSVNGLTSRKYGIKNFTPDFIWGSGGDATGGWVKTGMTMREGYHGGALTPLVVG